MQTANVLFCLSIQTAGVLFRLCIQYVIYYICVSIVPTFKLSHLSPLLYVPPTIYYLSSTCRALVLEMTGDIPDAEIKPPEEVLFVCKLNAVTTDADLELIFSRFGKIKQCEIIRDFKTGEWCEMQLVIIIRIIIRIIDSVIDCYCYCYCYLAATTTERQ